MPYVRRSILYALVLTISLACASPANAALVNTAPAIELAPIARNSLAGFQVGFVSVDYRVTDDQFDLVTLQVQFSTDGGLTFSPATEGIGGDGMVALTSSPSADSSNVPAASGVSPDGRHHVFMWNAIADIGLKREENVQLRFKANDGEFDSEPVVTETFIVDNTALTSQVVGLVRDRATRLPISGVQVKLFRLPELSLIDQGDTGALGLFNLDAQDRSKRLGLLFTHEDYDQ